MGETLPVHAVEETTAPAAAGHRVPVRIYRPTADAGLPVLVYLHGGGWILGDLDTVDAVSRRLAVTTGHAVVAVDYRLAPEHPFPVPLDDCYAAVSWLADNGARLGLDVGRLVVCGDSAGGHLTLGVAARARDEKGPHISLQVLIYPAVDDDMQTDSYRANGEGYFLTRDALATMWSCLAPESVREHPYVTPLRNGRLDGLPPAVVVTAGFDPLRSEGEELVVRLGEAGVPVSHRNFPGQIHGFLWMAGRLPAALDAFDVIATALRGSR
ncbi:alpha/beta hydrolase [Rhodococcus olei]|uniref:Alpha/beta hydrolase n=2 Tax=Rhodococcus olei TaxID=2161675 RepID=A0ABP8PG64_9NOCA